MRVTVPDDHARLRTLSALDIDVRGVEALAGIRASVRAELVRDGVFDGHVEAIMVLLSELVTNAFIHGTPPVCLTVAVYDASTVLSVHDESADMPCRRNPRGGAAGGFGLNLVAFAASDWGFAATDDQLGKNVWAVIPRSFTLTA